MLENNRSAARLLESAERSAFLADALRRRDGLRSSVRLQVYGESMLPALWPGDVVEITSCALAEVRPGEIVLALRDGRLFLHRLVSAKANGFVLRGDSMPGCDPLFPNEALLGRLARNAKESGRTSLGVKCSRAVGILICYCTVARRLALQLHSRRRASGAELQSLELL